METKLNSSFPQTQFYMSGFSKPYKLDRNNKGVYILFYIREGIISKSIPVSFNSNNLECLLTEIKKKKKRENKKWLLQSS